MRTGPVAFCACYFAFFCSIAALPIWAEESADVADDAAHNFFALVANLVKVSEVWLRTNLSELDPLGPNCH